MSNPKFQKRHYDFIAAALRSVVELPSATQEDKEAATKFAAELAEGFRADNPNFHAGRFYLACGL